MKRLFLPGLITFLILSCTDDIKRPVPVAEGEKIASEKNERSYDVEERMDQLGITLIPATTPTASFLKARRSGKLIYLSGHGPDKPSGGKLTGKLGSGLTVEQGKEAARLSGISLLSTLKEEIGDLNKVKRVIKVLGMVNADPSFTEHSEVMNGFSELMVEIFEESGKHARSSVGMGSLPGNIAVEIEMIVEVEDHGT